MADIGILILEHVISAFRYLGCEAFLGRWSALLRWPCVAADNRCEDSYADLSEFSESRVPLLATNSRKSCSDIEGASSPHTAPSCIVDS